MKEVDSFVFRRTKGSYWQQDVDTRPIARGTQTEQ